MAWSYTSVAIVVALLIAWFLRKPHHIPLRGPSRPNFLYGVRKNLLALNDLALAKYYGKCFKDYGPVFSLPWTLGTEKLIIADPKALQHIYSRDSYQYVKTAVSHAILENSLGRGLLWAEGDSHKRQRKALSPSFSNTSIRELAEVFQDASHKTKQAWQQIIEANNGQAIIDVHDWINRTILDIIGLAGFSHDFGLLSGNKAMIADKFESLGGARPGGVFFTSGLSVFAQAAPILLKIPSSDVRDMRTFRSLLDGIARELLEKSRIEMSERKDKSIIGLLVQAEKSEITTDEVLAQMNTMLFAGYATTAVTLMWALVELCKYPEKQTLLRQELAQSASEPTFDLLMGFPYLDAVVHETLRLHPAVPELNRVCTKDDVIPLSKAICLSTGEQVTSIPIRKGTLIGVSIYALNVSQDFWGPDAESFVPERWLSTSRAFTDTASYRQLASFADGTRTCLGKSFAVTELKVVLSTLIRNFSLEFQTGEKTAVSVVRSILPRPKVEGQGLSIPLLVRCVE